MRLFSREAVRQLHRKNRQEEMLAPGTGNHKGGEIPCGEVGPVDSHDRTVLCSIQKYYLFHNPSPLV